MAAILKPEADLDQSLEFNLEVPYQVVAPDPNHVTSIACPPEYADRENYASELALPRSESEMYRTGDKDLDKKVEVVRMNAARVRMDAIQAFVEDHSQTYFINGGKGPGNPRNVMSDEQLDELIALGAGTQGVHTVIEPADLDLYRSFIPAPLAMPEQPIVGASLLDMNQFGRKAARFQEGRFTIKVLCPDGLESWMCISTPVPFLHHTREGVIWGWPKYVADQISFTHSGNSVRAEVLYQGEERYSLHFTEGPVEDETRLKSFGKVEGGNTVTWHWIQGGAVCVRQGRGPGIDVGNKPARIVDWRAGQVKVHVRQSDPWAGLIPEDSVTDGWYQKWIGGGGGDSYWVKLGIVGGFPA